MARSLHQNYERNLDFVQFVERTGLPFAPLEHFRAAEIEQRVVLHHRIAELMWNRDNLLLHEGTA